MVTQQVLPPLPATARASIVYHEKLQHFLPSSARIELRIYRLDAILRQLFRKKKSFGGLKLAKLTLLNTFPATYFAFCPQQMAPCTERRTGRGME